MIWVVLNLEPLELSPHATLLQIACSWRIATGTILLLPDDVDIFRTTAVERRDEILTAVVLDSPDTIDKHIFRVQRWLGVNTGF